MSSLIIPGVTPFDSAVKTASHRLEEQFQQRLNEQREAITKSFEAKIEYERKFAEIGRTVIRALKNKGTNLCPGSLPVAGTDQVCARYATMGKDFDTLMEAVKRDVMLKSEWDRFCMMLRLAQEDNTDGE